MEITSIRGVLSRARRRIRIQAALDGATIATVPASAVGLAAVYGVRTENVAPTAGIAILVGAGLLIVVGAWIAAMRRLNDEQVARRLDRASNLSDRLSTAVAFHRVLGGSETPGDVGADLTRGMMIAAIRDGILAVPRAHVRAAVPFSWPRHSRIAAAFLAVSALTAGLRLPTPNRPGAPVAAASSEPSGHPTTASAIALDPDEKAYIEAIVSELRSAAERERVPELAQFAATVEKLIAEAASGHITKEALLDQLAKAEDALTAAAEPSPSEISKVLAEMGKTLGGDPLTAKLGEALQKNDIGGAEHQLKQLAESIASHELSPREKQRVSEQLKKAAQHLANQERDAQNAQRQRQQSLANEIRRLEAEQRQATDERSRREVERRLADAQRELQKLRKDAQDKQQSDQRRALRRLQKDVEQAADNLQKSDDQAAENLRDAAREAGRVDRDQRKQAAQKKMASQMDDLREAMRRAKQKPNKGPTDPFNKHGKNEDFIARARGQRGSSQAWKPNSGQPHPTGQRGGVSEQGNGAGSSSTSGSTSWGSGHDENLTGDPTAMSGNTEDQDLQGETGAQGGSTRETILAAAQKGFAGVGYKKVYANYERIVEEVMRTEKLPSSYKYYVKRYFAKIHPNLAATSGASESPPP